MDWLIGQPPDKSGATAAEGNLPKPKELDEDEDEDDPGKILGEYNRLFGPAHDEAHTEDVSDKKQTIERLKTNTVHSKYLNGDHNYLLEDSAERLLSKTNGESRVLQDICDDLEVSNATLQEDIKQAQQEIEDLKNARDKHIEQKRGTGDILKGLRENIGELEGRKRLLEKQLNDANSKIITLESELSDLRTSNALPKGSPQSEIDEWKRKRENAMQELRASKNELELELADLMQQRDAALQKAQTTEEKLVDVQNERDVLLQKVAAMDHSGAQSIEQVIAAHETIGVPEAHLQLQDTGIKARGLESETDILKDEKAALEHELAKVKTENARIQAELQSALGRDFSDPRAANSSTKGQVQTSSDGTRNLEKKLKELEIDNQAQKKQNSALEKELENTRNNLHVVVGEIEKMSAEVDDLEQDFVTTKKQNSQLLSQVEDAKKKLGKARILQENYGRLQEAYKQSQGALANQEAVNDEQQGRIKQLEAEYFRIQNENKLLRKSKEDGEVKSTKELQALRTERGDIKEKLGEKDFEIDELKFALTEADGTIKRQETKIQQLQVYLKESRDEAESLGEAKVKIERQYNSETTALKSRLDELKADLDQTNKDLMKAKEALIKSESVDHSQRRKIADLEDQVANAQNERDDIVKHQMERERDFVSKQRALEIELSDFKARLGALTTREASLGSELLATLRKEKEARRMEESMRANMESAEQARDEAIRAKKVLSKELSDASNQIDSLTRENQELSRQKKACHSEIENLRSIKEQNAGFSSQLSHVEGKKNESNQLAHLHHELERLRNAHQDENYSSRTALRDTEDLSRKLGARDAEVESLTKQLRQRISAFEDLKDVHHDLLRAHHGVVKANRDAAVALSKQLDERKAEIANLRLKLRTSDNENLSAREEIRQLKDNNQESEAVLKEIQNSFESTTKECEQLRSALERRAKDNEELAGSRDSLQECFEETKLLADNFRNRLRTEGESNNQRIQQLTRELIRAENQSRENARELNEVKAQLREMALERRSGNEANLKESNALREKLSRFELQFDESRKALSEAGGLRKTAEAELTSLRKKLALHENLSKSLERKGEISNQRQLEKIESLEKKAQSLEGNLISAEMQCANLEGELATVIAKRDDALGELGQVRDKLCKATSENSELKNSTEQAGSTLTDVTHFLSELLQNAPNNDGTSYKEQTQKGLSSEPKILLQKLKDAFENVIKSRDEEIEKRKQLKDSLDEVLTLSEGLPTTVTGQKMALARLQSTSREDKENSIPEQGGIDGTVDKVADIVLGFRTRLSEAEGEIEALRVDLQISKEQLEISCAENEALKDSNTKHKSDIGRLKGQIENTNLLAAKEALETSIDAVRTDGRNLYDFIPSAKMVARTDQTKRIAAMELSLAKKDERLREATRETQVLRDDAMKLKAFLETALQESKELLFFLLDASPMPESRRLSAHLVDNPSLDSSGRRVAAGLTKMIQRLAKKIDGLNPVVAPTRDGISGEDVNDNNKSKDFPHSDLSAMTKQEAGSGDRGWQKQQEQSRTSIPDESPAEKRQKTDKSAFAFFGGLDGKDKIEGDSRLSPATRRNDIAPREEPAYNHEKERGVPWEDSRLLETGRTAWGSFRESRLKPARLSRGSLEQKAYVQQRLAQSAAAGTYRGARLRPKRSSIEELIEPIVNPLADVSAAPFHASEPMLSHSRAPFYSEMSDHEVFNSPFIQSSQLIPPRGVPSTPRDVRRPSNTFRRPFTTRQGSSIHADRARPGGLLATKVLRPLSATTKMPTREPSLQAPAEDIDPPPGQSVDADGSFDGFDVMQKSNGLSKLDNARWALA